MNDIDFDELDRAIASVLEKDNTESVAKAPEDQADLAKPQQQSNDGVIDAPQHQTSVQKDTTDNTVAAPAVLQPVSSSSDAVENQKQTETKDAVVQAQPSTPQEQTRVASHIQQGQRQDTTKAQHTIADSLPRLTPVQASTPAQQTTPQQAVTPQHISTPSPSSVPPLVLPARRTALTNRTTSSALHTRVMPGRVRQPGMGSVINTASTPTPAAPVKEKSAPTQTDTGTQKPAMVVNDELKKQHEASFVSATAIDAELEKQVKDMTEKMTANLRAVKKEETKAKPVSTPVAAPAETNTAKHSDPVHIVEERQSKPNSRLARQSGRFMDMVHPSSDMRHMASSGQAASAAVSAAAVAPTAAATVSSSSAVMEAPDRTRQTDDDKAIEGEVHNLLSIDPAMVQDTQPLDSFKDKGAMDIEDTQSDTEDSLDEYDKAPSSMLSDDVSQADKTPEEEAVSEIESIEHGDEEVQVDTTNRTDAAAAVASTAVATTVATPKLSSDAQVVDTEAHPIFDTESYTKPITPEKKSASGKIWTILGSMLIILMIVAVVMVWQLLSA